MNETLERILQIFSSLAQNHVPVQLVNAYKGYPVSNDAVILSVFQQGKIRVQTHKHQTLCLYREQETVILGNAFPGYISSHVERLDIGSNTADLGRFEYIQESFKQRETARVMPRQPIEIWLTLRETGFRIKCEIADISIEGMAVLLPIEFYVPNRIRLGAEVLVSFELAMGGAGPPVEIRGRGMIRNTMGSAGLQKKRIGIRMHYEGQQSYLITQFIQLRIQEIAREMDLTYAAMARIAKPGNV